MSSYFGNEVSSCLHEVSYSDKHLDLNGFLSGPAGSGFGKVHMFSLSSLLMRSIVNYIGSQSLLLFFAGFPVSMYPSSSVYE